MYSMTSSLSIVSLLSTSILLNKFQSLPQLVADQVVLNTQTVRLEEVYAGPCRTICVDQRVDKVDHLTVPNLLPLDISFFRSILLKSKRT